MSKLFKYEEHIGFWMRFVSNHVSHSFKKKLESHDVGVAEWVVLRRLSIFTTLSPHVLAEMTGMTRGAISKLLDKLFHKKFIEREECCADRRCLEIRLSKEGKALVPQLATLADKNDEQFFGHLSKRKKAELLHLLKEIVAVNQLTEIPIN